MGKRSDFEKRERDLYETPKEAVIPLLPFLSSGSTFASPCAGARKLINHIEELTDLRCTFASDIYPLDPRVIQMDYTDVTRDMLGNVDYIIENPPWSRDKKSGYILHNIIRHFAPMKPTWLLFDADWVHTKQSKEFLPWLDMIVSVGRVKWIEDSKMTGKDNTCWYCFDANRKSKHTTFIGRD